MYFLILILLLVLLIPLDIEKNNKIILYLKVFTVSTIHFYYIDTKSIINVFISLFSFIIIIGLIYRTIKISTSKEENDNNLYNLVHEIKNPIAVSKGYLDMLDKDNNKINKYLPIIKNEIARSLNIMDEYLSFKRIKLTKDIMDFSLLLDDIKETTTKVLDNNSVNLDIINTDQEIIMDGDYDKLKQVLINLVKNSYEAEAKNVKISFKINNNYLKLKIADDGKGMTKHDLDKIGTIFYTTKVSGTGIGVNLSKEIIKLHEGSLSYKSILNKGTIATIILPIKYVF